MRMRCSASSTAARTAVLMRVKPARRRPSRFTATDSHTLQVRYVCSHMLLTLTSLMAQRVQLQDPSNVGSVQFCQPSSRRSLSW